MGLSAATTNYGLIGPTAFYSATNVILTPVGGSSPSFTAGVVRLALVYLSFSPPTS
jgi:hypothetical protein